MDLFVAHSNQSCLTSLIPISNSWVFLLILSIAISGCSGIGGGGSDTALAPIPNAWVEGCYVEHYPDPTNSDYILPYEVSMSFQISQGNCGEYTHQPRCTGITAAGVVINCGDLRYSYDFAIPVGINILAARGGTVILTEDRFSNSTTGSKQENYIVIEHSDNTATVYAHFSPRGVLVEVGDKVSQGDVIGIAGSSGYAGPIPHLHFHVVVTPLIKCGPEERSGCKTVSVTFRNAKPLDAPLFDGSTYKALSF